MDYEESNRCVCCGEEIPEGWQVCPNCEAEVKEDDLDSYSVFYSRVGA